MTRSDIRDWFSRNKKRSDVDRALAVISQAGLAQARHERGNGGPAVERWTVRA